MHDFIKKLLDSKSTIIIVLWIVVFAYVYNLDLFKKTMDQPTAPKGRPIEEIIATPVDNSAQPEWDKDFKSSIETVK